MFLQYPKHLWSVPANNLDRVTHFFPAIKPVCFLLCKPASYFLVSGPLFIFPPSVWNTLFLLASPHLLLPHSQPLPLRTGTTRAWETFCPPSQCDGDVPAFLSYRKLLGAENMLTHFLFTVLVCLQDADFYLTDFPPQIILD